MSKIKIFITYSHNNKKEKEELVRRLQSLEEEYSIDLWHDDQMLAGDKWEHKISENLKDSDILLYLTSNSSLNSKACNKELTEALQREGQTRIIPIILEQCDWKDNEIGNNTVRLDNYLALPKDGKPINEWKPRSEGWQNVIDGICRVIEDYQSPSEAMGDSSASDSQPPKPSLDHANFLTMLGQYEEASEVYDEVLKNNPQYVEAYNNRGLAKMHFGNYKEAIEDFDKVLEIDPQNLRAFYNRGLVKFHLRNYKKAIEDFDKAIEIAPQDAEVYRDRALTKFYLENYEEAMEDSEKALKINPEDARTYNNRALAKAGLGEYKKAIEDFDNAIEIDPRNFEAYNNRGHVRATLGNYKEAIEDFDKAIEINPQCKEAHYNRGNAKFALGDLSGAIADLKKALEFDSQNEKILRRLGEVKAQLDDLENQ